MKPARDSQDLGATDSPNRLDARAPLPTTMDKEVIFKGSG